MTAASVLRATSGMCPFPEPSSLLRFKGPTNLKALGIPWAVYMTNEHGPSVTRADVTTQAAPVLSASSTRHWPVQYFTVLVEHHGTSQSKSLLLSLGQGLVHALHESSAATAGSLIRGRARRRMGHWHDVELRAPGYGIRLSILCKSGDLYRRDGKAEVPMLGASSMAASHSVLSIDKALFGLVRHS